LQNLELTMTNPASFLSTALPYVNAAPHLGHALELVQADAILGFERLRGSDVRFVSGSDDNSLKNVRAAERLGVATDLFVAENARRCVALSEGLGVHHDAFVHTGSDATHRAAVAELWRRCARAGDIYRDRYRGLYCVGCEQFFSETELRDGVCPEHGTLPE